MCIRDRYSPSWTRPRTPRTRAEPARRPQGRTRASSSPLGAERVVDGVGDGARREHLGERWRDPAVEPPDAFSPRDVHKAFTRRVVRREPGHASSLHAGADHVERVRRQHRRRAARHAAPEELGDAGLGAGGLVPPRDVLAQRGVGHQVDPRVRDDAHQRGREPAEQPARAALVEHAPDRARDGGGRGARVQTARRRHTRRGASDEEAGGAELLRAAARARGATAAATRGGCKETYF